MLYYGANVLLLECLMRQAHADTAARCGYSDIATEDAAVRVRADAAEFVVAVQSVYIETRDEAGAVMDVISRRRLAWPIVNEAEGPVGLYRCTRCGEGKERADFYTVKKTHYAPRRDSWCILCRRVTKRVNRGGGTANNHHFDGPGGFSGLWCGEKGLVGGET